VKVHRSTRISGVLAAALLVTATPQASAHHSAAPFDMTQQITVTGAVEKWMWSNPHSWLYISVKKPDGTKQIWGLEAGSAGMLARHGWSARDMKAGDIVTVTASPARGGKPVGLILAIKLPNGKTLTGGGPPPPSNGGAPAAKY
jgi:Family of unknown function (DUF6152)